MFISRGAAKHLYCFRDNLIVSWHFVENVWNTNPYSIVGVLPSLLSAECYITYNMELITNYCHGFRLF